ncbi:Phosphoribosylformylglycinamidine synthase subunit PurQ [archaeon HR06]|nr:Phosphoribosylformylglycinamidine synthase subunit PurQ [archaeon HR06]
MKVAIIVFPGTNCDWDTYHVLKNVTNYDVTLLWHNSDKRLDEFDAIILPGGFSYGDHLRAGVIAAHSPIMKEVKRQAKDNKLILGICNGFQILVEAKLLEGALLRNSSLKFICKWVNLKVENKNTPFTNRIIKNVIKLPIAHNEGRYYVDEDTLDYMRRKEMIIFRYCGEEGEVSYKFNPNGSLDNIAGVCNYEKNVLGLMPHPERASERILSPFNSEDGRYIFESMRWWLCKG